jgi:hypothetical protein
VWTSLDAVRREVVMMKSVLSVAFVLILIPGLFNSSALMVSAQTAQSSSRQTLENRQPTRQRRTEPPKQQQQAVQEQAQQPQIPPAEATVTLNEQFLNALLDAVFTNLRPPSFPLSLSENSKPTIKTPKGATALAPSSSQCSSQIVLEREMSGVRTAVRFENGRITAPLAFTGTYNTGLLGCMRFQGWADTVINLEFNRERQSLNARVDVVDIHLNGVPQLANGVVVQMVQNAIDQRVNPVEILQANQLTTRLPISAAGGALRLRAKDLRPEIVPGAIRLHIIYEFIRAD